MLYVSLLKDSVIKTIRFQESRVNEEDCSRDRVVQELVSVGCFLGFHEIVNSSKAFYHPSWMEVRQQKWT
jgi:hypothetical protein